MGEVLIDTSAWIAFFRPGDGPVSRTVEELIRADRAALCGPVLAELLRGVRNECESTQLHRLLSILVFHETERTDWEETGHLLRSLQSRGITVPLTDALIATLAARREMTVLTLDKRFASLPAALLDVE